MRSNSLKNSGDKDLEPRLIHQYPVGLLTYMLGEYCRFSQMRSHFPNIFLVNIEQGEEGVNNDPYSSEHMHLHTYWLKWLIAKLIEKEKNYDGSSYVGIFKGKRGDGYGEKEIRKCLGSLCQANLTNMARAQFEPNHSDPSKLVIKGIVLTPRGRYCLANIFHRFFYLQLIVDDNLLPLPRCIITDDFSYKLHYGYVTAASKEEYWEYAKQMIVLKAKQVFLFLVVLEESLAIEKDIHSSIFQRLAIDNVFAPDIKNIVNSIEIELKTILKNVYIEYLNLDYIKEYAERKRKSIREELNNMYNLK